MLLLICQSVSQFAHHNLTWMKAACFVSFLKYEINIIPIYVGKHGLAYVLQEYLFMFL
jgi:hypothetical protein